MSQSYTGGDITKVTGNASVYLTHGGTDSGLMSPDVTVNLAPSSEPMHFAQAQAAYGKRTIEGNFPFVSGEIHEITQAMALKLHPDAVTLDSGNSIGHDGDYGIVMPTSEGWLYWLHNLADLPKRLKFPAATFEASGEMEMGSQVGMFRQGFQMSAMRDASGTADERLWRMYWNEDADLVTVTPSPADAATGVAVDAAVTLTFSEAIGEDFRVTAADNPYIFIMKDDGTEATTGITWNAAGLVATIAHANFGASTQYHIIVSGSIRSTEGKLLAGNGTVAGTKQIVNFTTA